MSDSAKTTMRILVCCLLALLAWCAVVVPRVAVAQETPQMGTLTVAFQAEGMRFSLFRVGDIGPMNNRTDLQFIEPFAGYAGDWPGTQDTLDYDALAQRLADGASEDSVEALRQGSIVDGSWAAGEVAYGWYLIVGEPVSFNGYVWYAKPTLVRVPTVVDGVEQSQVTASPKYSKVPEYEKGTEVEHRLVKQWVSDSADVRPSEVRIALVHGGEVAQTVTLNGDNNWSYAWTCADDGVAWTAVEQDVPSGYEATVRAEGNRITVQNVRQSTGGGKVAGGTNGTSGTNAANDENAAPVTGSAGSTSLATTGDNSILTPMAVVLAAVGVLAIVLGWTWRTRSRVMMVVGVAAILAAGGLVCWGVRAEAAERQACDDALADLVELLPETTQGHVSGDADVPLAVMAVDGRDLVGYLDMGSGLGRIPVHAGTDGRGAHLVSGSPRTGTATIANVDVALDKVHAGDTVSFVDVDGVSYDYVIDAVAQADASAHDGMVLQVPGMAEGAALICKA